MKEVFYIKSTESVDPNYLRFDPIIGWDMTKKELATAFASMNDASVIVPLLLHQFTGWQTYKIISSLELEKVEYKWTIRDYFYPTTDVAFFNCLKHNVWKRCLKNDRLVFNSKAEASSALKEIKRQLFDDDFLIN